MTEFTVSEVIEGVLLTAHPVLTLVLAGSAPAIVQKS